MTGGKKNTLAQMQAQVQSQVKDELENHFKRKPAILITGQHHSREHITVNVAFFSLLKMLHNGLAHFDKSALSLLKQNKYYVIPSVNVDGVAFIENRYLATGQLLRKRKNMHQRSDACGPDRGGVDLNRNYGYKFGFNEHPTDNECKGDTWGGPSAFSEPETRAIRDFVTSKKDELNLVYNLHCAGNQFIIPFNGEFPNNSTAEIP